MDDSFTIQISHNLVKQLAEDGENLKKKSRKPKPKVPRTPRQPSADVTPKLTPDDTQASVKGGPTAPVWPLQSPLFLPVPTSSQPANTELDAIRSVIKESERVVERLKKQEEEMALEVTKKAKDLYEKEFKLPYQKPMPCSADFNACLECYKEHAKDPLKCASFVKSFKDCVDVARQQANSAVKPATV